MFVGALEDNFDDPTMHAVEGLINQAGFPPGTHFVRNANGYLPPGWHRERHGNGRAVCNAGGDIWSNDGYSMDAQPLESLSYFGECGRVMGLALFHSPKNQGVVAGQFLPVEKRTYHVMTQAEQDQMQWILEQETPAPTAPLLQLCPKGFLSIEYPVLYKPASDGTNPPRAGKPGLLAPAKQMLHGTGAVYNNLGQTVARFGGYGTFGTDHWRSYSCWGQGTCETAQELAVKASPAYFQAQNGQCFGPLYAPGYRQGAVQ